RLFGDSPDLCCRLLGRVVQGRFVVDHEEVTGLRGGDKVHAVAIYEVAEGLIRRVWFLKQAE
ncbi:MAG: amidohydrolase family protein, partial [Planctomycetota bacterium]